MPAYLDLAPIDRVDGSVALPGSKSISNRTLLLAALAAGDTRVRGLLDADDVDRMREALAALGVRIDPPDDGGDLVVHGTAGVIPGQGGQAFSRQCGNGIPAAHGGAGARRRNVSARRCFPNARAADRRSRRSAAFARRRHPLSRSRRLSAAGHRAAAARPRAMRPTTSRCAATCRANFSRRC